MRQEPPTGYEQEPREHFEPLPARLYSSFYHLTAGDGQEEETFYLNHLNSYGCTRILELGCGTGRISEALRSQGVEITGIDLAWEMLAFARRCRLAPVVQMDMRNLGFHRTFQAVIIPCNTLNLLHAPEQISACLSGLRSVLLPPALLIAHLYVPDRKIRKSAGQRLFQFHLHDLEDGRKLIKETIRRYESATQLLELEERYKVRDFSGNGRHRNFSHTLKLNIPAAAAWFHYLEDSGFTVRETFASFEREPFHEGTNSTFLAVAQSIDAIGR